VDLPPISETYTEGWVFGLIRNADRVCVLLDLSTGDLEAPWQQTLALLQEKNIQLVGEADAAVGPGTNRQKALVVGSKADLAPPSALEQLQAALDPDFALQTVSQQGPLEALRRALFELLDVVRVYSKEPGQSADTAEPFVLKRGSTALDLARAIHRDLVEQMRFARIWGSGQFDGQRVPQDHVLQDQDVLEIHT